MLYNTKEGLKTKWAEFCSPPEASVVMEIIGEGE